MKLRLRVCKDCGNVKATPYDDEGLTTHCSSCNAFTTHSFTDVCFNEISIEAVQKEIDGK